MKSSVDSHTIYLVGTMVPCTIFAGHNHEPEAFPLMETFRHLCTKHNFHQQEIDHPKRGPSLALSQAPIMEIIPPPNSDDMIHHIRFISSCIRTMTQAICSSAIGVESAATTRVTVPTTVETQSIYTLSTAFGSTTSTMESFSCLSTSSIWNEPILHNLAQNPS